MINARKKEQSIVKKHKWKTAIPEWFEDLLRWFVLRN